MDSITVIINTLLSQQMLDAIKHIVDNSIDLWCHGGRRSVVG